MDVDVGQVNPSHAIDGRFRESFLGRFLRESTRQRGAAEGAPIDDEIFHRLVHTGLFVYALSHAFEIILGHARVVNSLECVAQLIPVVFARAPKTRQRSKLVIEYQATLSGIAEVKLERPTTREGRQDLGCVELFVFDDVQ